MPDRKRPPRLIMAIFGSFILGAVVLALSLGAVLPEYARAVADRALDRSVQTRTESAALDLARALHSDWSELRHLGERIHHYPPDQLGLALDGMVGSGVRVAWAGFADLNGTIVAASRGMLEGADVSARPWFEAGLRARVAIDVHDALLLNRLLGGDDDNPIRFVDFAMPVTDRNGEASGVMATHTAFGWIEHYLAESATVRGMDLFLLSGSGELIFGTDTVEGDLSRIEVIRSAATGVATQTREQWPDGRAYFSSTVPHITYSDLPSFGWRLVGRVPADAYDSDRRALFGTLLAVIAGAVTMFGLVAGLFAYVFLRPISRLVDAADAIAAGEKIYPPESRSSAEAVRLSSALARLQTGVEGYAEQLRTDAGKARRRRDAGASSDEK